MHELSRRFRFESAHRLPHVPPGHKCARLHGHSFRCDILVRGPLDPVLGWVLDFGAVKAAVQPIVEQLDHRYLNEIEGLENPTSEVLSAWIWHRVAARLPGLYAVRILETCNSACTYFGPEGR